MFDSLKLPERSRAKSLVHIYFSKQVWTRKRQRLLSLSTFYLNYSTYILYTYIFFKKNLNWKVATEIVPIYYFVISFICIWCTYIFLKRVWTGIRQHWLPLSTILWNPLKNIYVYYIHIYFSKRVWTRKRQRLLSLSII